MIITSFKYRTQNTEHRTQNTEHRTQNTEHRTQNTEIKVTVIAYKTIFSKLFQIKGVACIWVM